jgi:transposase
LIIEEHYTISKAAKRLGVKASTARMILNKFKETGKFPMKERRSPKKTVKKNRRPLNEISIFHTQEENMGPSVRT